jgi:flagellum-specific peptidoglycan hydrolase FlgJ
MRRIDKHLRSVVGFTAVLVISTAALAQTKSSAQSHDPQLESASPASVAQLLTGSSDLPDSPGAQWAMSRDGAREQSNSQQPSTQTAQQQSAAPQEQTAQRPVGTAAAEAPKVTGITAAQPAGVAIAPGKQRRVRTIVLKVGAIVGAGAALGTVIALSAGTSSKPPGAH